jgi:hypothetical protein
MNDGEHERRLSKLGWSGCQSVHWSYSDLMRISRKIGSVVLATLVVGFLTGCAGITAPLSVSPATFLLPGLMEVPQEAPPVVVAPAEVTNRQLSALIR